MHIMHNILRSMHYYGLQITKLWNIHMTIYKNTIQMTKWGEIFIRKMAKGMNVF